MFYRRGGHHHPCHQHPPGHQCGRCQRKIQREQELAGLRQQIATLEANLKSSQDQQRAATQESCRSQAELQAKEQEFRELTVKLSRVNRIFDTFKQAASKEKDELQVANIDLRRSLEKERLQNSEFQATISQLIQREQEAKQELNQASDQLRILTSKYDEIVREEKDTQDKNITLERRVEQMQSELTDITLSERKAKKQATALQEQLNRAQDELAEFTRLNEKMGRREQIQDKVIAANEVVQRSPATSSRSSRSSSRFSSVPLLFLYNPFEDRLNQPDDALPMFDLRHTVTDLQLMHQMFPNTYHSSVFDGYLNSDSARKRIAFFLTNRKLHEGKKKSLLVLWFTGHGSKEDGSWLFRQSASYGNSAFPHPDVVESIAPDFVFSTWYAAQMAIQETGCKASLLIVSRSCYSGKWVTDLQRYAGQHPTVRIAIQASTNAHLPDVTMTGQMEPSEFCQAFVDQQGQLPAYINARAHVSWRDDLTVPIEDERIILTNHEAQ